MHISKEILAKARAELARQRADQESKNAAALAEAYRRVPQLRQLDSQLRATMALAAQAVFAQGGDAAAAMEEAKAQNLALQAQRRELLLAHMGVEELTFESLCPHCGGTGYVGAEMCRCLEALCLRFQQEALGKVFAGNARFENFRLDYYPDAPIPPVKISARSVMEKNLNHCRQYARNFSLGVGNLLISGHTGLGKTHMALAIGRAVAEQGYSVCYETAAGLFSKLEKAKFYPTPEARAQAEALETCDLLIIDDLGTELPGQFVTASLYALLNQRLMADKSMVITMNLLIEEADDRYNSQVASRLYGQFNRLTFLGKDIRKLKLQEGAV